MELKLERPLLFFDIESTGLNIAVDSIIELSFVKIMPDNEQRIKTWRVKPWVYDGEEGPGSPGHQRPITPGAKAVNGISDEELQGEKRFCDIVGEIVDWLKDSDLAGYNSAKFDLPMLAEEIERVVRFTGRKIDLDLHDARMVDVQTIYHKMEPRNLKAAYRFYVGGDFENAHAAEADTLATYEVLKGQLSRYSEEQIKNDVAWLASFTELQKTVDFAGRIALNQNKEPIITFGKHKGRTVKEVLRAEPSYFDWIDRGEFTLDTKRQFARLRAQYTEEFRRPLDGKSLNDGISRLQDRFNRR